MTSDSMCCEVNLFVSVFVRKIQSWFNLTMVTEFPVVRKPEPRNQSVVSDCHC